MSRLRELTKMHQLVANWNYLFVILQCRQNANDQLESVCQDP